MARILVVEDNVILAEEIKDWLEDSRYIVEVVHNGEEALSRLKFYSYDAIVLDWMLPGMTGLSLCAAIRGRQLSASILMLTARSELKDKVDGFNAGADDYLTKPFEMPELLSRLKALLRRPREFTPELLCQGNITVDRRNFRVVAGGVEIELQPKEFKLLELLIRHPGRVFLQDEIVERISSYDDDTTSDSLRKTISRLRKKLERGGGDQLIVTVHGVGYKFAASDD